MKFTVSSLALTGLFPHPAVAATLTSTFQFTASGTIGAQNFTNAAITLTPVGDTLNRQTYYVASLNSMYYIFNDSVTISVSGVGTFQFSTPGQTLIFVENASFSDNLPPGSVNSGTVAVHFRNGSAAGGQDLIFSNKYSMTAPWDMTSSLSLFTSALCSVSNWNTAGIVTSGGVLNLYDLSFAICAALLVQATVTPTVAVTPTQFNLSYQIGGALPVGVLQVSGMGSAKAYTASASASGNWLSANPMSGTTPATGTSPITVNISPSALNAGTYSGTVSVTQNGATVIVPVNLTVTAPFTPSIYDVNGDGVVNVTDVQRVINAALGGNQQD